MNSFLLAFRFLTIIPWGHGQEINSDSVAAAGKYYPLVGSAIGGLLWVFFYGVNLVFPTPVSTGLLVVFWVVLTGALHLDGLADCLDGLYGGTESRKTFEYHEGCSSWDHGDRRADSDSGD